MNISMEHKQPNVALFCKSQAGGATERFIIKLANQFTEDSSQYARLCNGLFRRPCRSFRARLWGSSVQTDNEVIRAALEEAPKSNNKVAFQSESLCCFEVSKVSKECLELLLPEPETFMSTRYL